MATIGSLLIGLGLNSARFDAGMRDATRSTERFKKRAGKNFAAVGQSIGGLTAKVAALAGPAVLGAATKRALDMADAIGKVADRAGISTDALQSWRHMASLAGLSTQELDGAMVRAGKRIGEAFNEAGPAFKTLQRLGVSVKNQDGTIRDTEAVLLDFADALGEMESASERAGAAAALFDVQVGIKMAHALQDGSSAMLQAIADARELGIVLDESLIRNAEAANDKLNIMGTVLSAQVTKGLLEAAPAIIQVGNAFAKAIPVVAQFAQWLARTGEIGTIRRIREIKTEIGELEESLRSGGLEATALFALGFGDITDVSREKLKNLRAELEKLQKQLRQGDLDIKRGDASLLTLPDLDPRKRPDGDNPAEVVIDRTVKRTTRATREIQTTSERAAEKFTDAFADAFSNFDSGVDGMVESFKRGLARMAQDMLRSQITRMLGSLFARFLPAAGGAPVGDAGVGSGGGVLTTPIPLPGLQHGGNFKVGGTGGTDSKIVAFRGTPGEHVSITPKGHGGGGAITINSGDVVINGGGDVDAGMIRAALDQRDAALIARLREMQARRQF